jgi:hypothetical protein
MPTYRSGKRPEVLGRRVVGVEGGELRLAEAMPGGIEDSEFSWVNECLGGLLLPGIRNRVESITDRAIRVASWGCGIGVDGADISRRFRGRANCLGFSDKGYREWESEDICGPGSRLWGG